MKKKVLISLNKAKFISSVLVAILVGAIIFALSNYSIHQTSVRVHQEQDSNYSHIAEAYAEALNFSIDNYITLLNAYYLDTNYGSVQEIQSFLKGLIPYREKTTPEFTDIFFVTPDYKGYSQSGNVFDLIDSVCCKEIFSGNSDSYVSDPMKIPTTEKPVVIIAKGIKANNGKLIGIICGVLPLENLTEKFTNIKIGKSSSIIIVDGEGRFIVNQDTDWLYKKISDSPFVPEGASPEKMSKDFDSHFHTKDVYGNNVALFFKTVKNTNWVVVLPVFENEEEEIYLSHKKNIFHSLILSCIVMILLLVTEYYVLEFFQKRQVISSVYDPLTNLWTRQYFEKEATKLLKFFPRSKFMLIECDIRKFKFTNQSYGEETADKILVTFSKILSKYAHQYRAIMGRGFADRFYVLLRVSSVHKAMNIFKDIVDQINSDILDYDYPFFPKFGISFLLPSKERNITIQGLIGQASFAKSTIKDNALVQYSIYNSRLLKKVNEEQFIEAHMQAALDNGEFFVMYQPKMDLSTEKVSGAEALVRWRSPDLGLLNPDQFIPLFEKNGFITKLDFFVYEEVFKFLQSQLKKGNEVVPISVNMSRNHSKPEKFIHQFMDIFKKYSIPAKYVQIEILERSFSDSDTLKEITDYLHKEGFTVAMDDFGKGESSLNMLTHIPVDILKFDRDFLNSSTLETGDIDSKSAGFIEILITLSKHLNKETVFEGVETQQQKDFLKSIDCDQAQGFFYSKPLVQDDFEKYIQMHS